MVYWRSTPASVKCGKEHLTTNCRKVVTTFAKYLHCNQYNPANYRRCPIYQQSANVAVMQEPYIQTIRVKIKCGVSDLPVFTLYSIYFSNV